MADQTETITIKGVDLVSGVNRQIADGFASSAADIKAKLAIATQAVKDIEKATKEWATSSGQVLPALAAELAKAKDAEQALKQELASVDEAAKSNTTAMTATAVATGAVAEHAEKSRLSLQQLGTSLNTIGRDLSLFVTAPIVGAAVASEHFAAEFQTQMTRVQTLAGASKEEVARMGQELLDLAPKVGVGPAELAKGLFVVESAGYKGAEAMKVLTTASEMSALGMGKTEDVTRALIGSMLTYTKEQLSAAQAGDILVKTVQLGNMKIDELVPALARVNPLAAALGVSFADVTSAIATFTHMGASAETAATGLRAVLSNILNDSVKTEKGFKLLSQTLGDSSISMVNFRKEMADQGLGGALLDLMTKANAAGEKGTEALNKIFPNVKALTEVLAIAGSQGENYARITREMHNANGVLADGFAATQQTFDQHWKVFLAESEKLGILLGNELLPQLTKLLDHINNEGIPAVEGMIKAWRELPEPVKAASEVMVALVAAGGPVLIGLGAVARAVGAINALLFGANAAADMSLVAWLGRIAGFASKAPGSMLGMQGLLAAADTAETRDVKTDPTLRALVDKAMGVPTVLAPSLFQGGAGASPFFENTRGNVPGDITNGFPEATAVVGTLLERVKALTAAQREEIDADKAQGLSIAEIAKETGIAADVLGVYERQKTASTRASKDHEKALREEEKALQDQIKDIEYYRGMGEKAAAEIGKSLGGQKGVLVDLMFAINPRVDPNFVGPLEEQVYKDLQDHPLPPISAKAIVGLNTLQTTAHDSGSQSTFSSFDLVPDISGFIKQKMTGLKLSTDTGDDSLASQLFGGLVTSFPQFLEKAILHGQDLPQAVKAEASHIGSEIGKEMFSVDNWDAESGERTGIGGLLSKMLPESFAKAIPGIGAAIGALAGPLISWIAGLFDHKESDIAHIAANSYGVSLTQSVNKGIHDTMASLNISEQAATIFDASKIFPTVDSSNFASAVKITHDAFSMIQTGQLSVAQGGKVLDDMWPKLAAAGTDAYGRISNSLKDLIALNDTFGTHSKGIADFLKAQAANAIAGFADLAAAFDGSVTGYDDIKKAVDDANAAVQGLHKSTVDYKSIIASMGAKEHEALTAGFASAQAGGFKGDIVSFFQQQAELYKYAPEGDSRLKTWLGGDTMNAIVTQQRAAADAVTAVIDQMQASEKKALQDGFAQALQDGFKGTLSDFLLQQNQLYGVAKEGDARLQTWLSGRTIDMLSAIPAVDQYNKAVGDQQAAAERAKDALQDLQTTALLAFNAATASGQTFAQALKAIAPQLTSIEKSYKDLGISIKGTPIEALLKQNDVAMFDPVAATGISGLTASFTAASNMPGVMTPEAFAAMERLGADLYSREQNAAYQSGLARGDNTDQTAQALLPMQQWLHEAADYAKANNLKLDAQTQAEIDASKTLGIWKDDVRTDAQRQYDSTTALIKSNYDLIAALSGTPNKDNSGAGSGGSGSGDTVINKPGGPSKPVIIGGGGDDIGGNRVVPMADGGFGMVTSPTLFLAGERGPEQFAFSGAGRTFGSPTMPRDATPPISVVVHVDAKGAWFDQQGVDALARRIQDGFWTAVSQNKDQSFTKARAALGMTS